SIGAISDISDLKILSDRMQERTQELIQTEKMASIGLLISEVAHEVNNPISFILSNTETSRDYFKTLLEFLKFQEKALETDKLEKDAETPSNSAIVLARIHKQRKKLNLDFIIKDLPKLLESNLKGLERVRDVVSDLRMASRPVSDLKYVPVNLQESLDLVINMLGHRLSPLIKILKEYGLPPRLQKVSAIPAKLDQIWVNLITNAIQAIEEKDPARGKIVVKTSLEKEKLLKVEIIDDGIGISPDNKQKIFHPFFTTKAPTKGTGLGLSICMRIVQEFGGAIALFSEGEGKGAKVVVSLPTIAEQTE
ncbi:MAG TPA: ATP-binding protein, partial [Candidatus Hodarchaeales archaeon]|nr:ATP-binding protein [Candidatus Hodarchaeales archaeon]